MLAVALKCISPSEIPPWLQIPITPATKINPQRTISLMMLQRSLAFDCIVPMVRYVEQSSYRVDEVRIQVVRSSSEVWSPHNTQHPTLTSPRAPPWLPRGPWPRPARSASCALSTPSPLHAVGSDVSIHFNCRVTNLIFAIDFLYQGHFAAS